MVGKRGIEREVDIGMKSRRVNNNNKKKKKNKQVLLQSVSLQHSLFVLSLHYALHVPHSSSHTAMSLPLSILRHKFQFSKAIPIDEYTWR